MGLAKYLIIHVAEFLIQDQEGLEGGHLYSSSGLLYRCGVRYVFQKQNDPGELNHRKPIRNRCYPSWCYHGLVFRYTYLPCYLGNVNRTNGEHASTIR